MIRTFCDGCGTEITDKRLPTTTGRSRDRFSGSREFNLTSGSEGVLINKLGFEIITSLNGTSNAGHFCISCIIESVMSYDDRDMTTKMTVLERLNSEDRPPTGYKTEGKAKKTASPRRDEDEEDDL